MNSPELLEKTDPDSAPIRDEGSVRVVRDGQGRIIQTLSERGSLVRANGINVRREEIKVH